MYFEDKTLLRSQCFGIGYKNTKNKKYKKLQKINTKIQKTTKNTKIQKTGSLNNCELQPDMIPCVPLGHYYTFNMDVVKHFIPNIKFLTFHFPEAMQHKFAPKFP